MKICKYSPSEAAFTVIELLAATAVFALMMVFTAQMIGHTTKISEQTSKQSESQNGAQAGLDAMARDLRNMVRTQGFTLVGGSDASGTPANNNLAFLCISRGSSAASQRFMGVCYRIDNANNPALLRMETSVPWTQSIKGGITAAAALATATIPGDVLPITISDKVIRLEISYVWKNGKVTQTIPANETGPNGFIYNLNEEYGMTGMQSAVNLSNLSAIVIGVVAIDQKSQDLLESSAGIRQMAALFPAVPDDKLPLEYWTTNTNIWAGVKGPVKTGLRTFQRIVPIN